MNALYEQIPLLEFDPDASAVMMPNHEHFALTLPRLAAFPFLGEHIEEYARTHPCEKVAEFVSATKVYPVYVTTYANQQICLVQAPVGAAAAAQLLDWLIGYGVEVAISAGSCGALLDFPENTFLIPNKALRDEGTSYHYVKPSRYIDINPKALRVIEATLTKQGIPYREVTTWSTDGIFRETKAKVIARTKEGCAVVEMECSALAAVASLRNIVWGTLLFTADSLSNIEAHDRRNWGSDSFAFALIQCMEVLCTYALWEADEA